MGRGGRGGVAALHHIYMYKYTLGVLLFTLIKLRNIPKSILEIATGPVDRHVSETRPNTTETSGLVTV